MFRGLPDPDSQPRHPRPDKVAQLEDALIKDDAAEAREGIHALVETIILAPENGRLQVEVRGEFAAILSLADGAKAPR